MMTLLRDLGATDPGLLLVIGLIFGAVFGIVLTALCFSWGKPGGAL